MFGEIANVDYEGEIQGMGDTVHIRTTPDITINDYAMGQRLNFENPEPSLVDLLINKGKYFAFRDDDVQKVQSDYNYVDDWTADAGTQMAITIDSQILTTIDADVHASNTGTSAGAISTSVNLGEVGAPLTITAQGGSHDVVDKIADMGQVLDEQNVPNENRWIVAPAWFCNRIKKSELQDASLSGDGTSIARNGRVGIIDRFTIYMSNQVETTATAHHILFGHKSALTFASQLVKTEGPMKHPEYFGDFYRGLQVYGFKTVKPEAMGVLYGAAS